MKTDADVCIKKNVQKQKEISGFMYQRALSPKGRNRMKTS